MAIYEITTNELKALQQTNFASEGLRERTDLQRLLRDQIKVLDPGLLVIAEEFGDWEESNRRIDLLAIDQDANLVVIELKRTESGGHMELQALRYAAMVSTMTFDKGVEAYGDYLGRMGRGDDPASILLKFLKWNEPNEEHFAQEVRVVLASADFSKELTTTVLWLNQCGLDIRCVRLRPYSDGDRVLLDVQQIIPLPEAEEFQVQVREKAQRERQTRSDSRDMTRYDVEVLGKKYPSSPKRIAILRVIQALVQSGHAPEEFWSLEGMTKGNFLIAEGDFKEEQDFIKAVTQSGENFKPIRWFTASDQLLHHNGRTYALVKNVWDRQRWNSAMSALADRYPEARMQWPETESAG